MRYKFNAHELGKLAVADVLRQVPSLNREQITVNCFWDLRATSRDDRSPDALTLEIEIVEPDQAKESA